MKFKIQKKKKTDLIFLQFLCDLQIAEEKECENWIKKVKRTQTVKEKVRDYQILNALGMKKKTNE